DRLITVLKSLRDLGNTVIVVEHEEKIMKAADQIIDIGPDAGAHGGELVFQGDLGELLEHGDTYTAKYLQGVEKISLKETSRPWKDSIQIRGARENNLKNVSVKIPLGVLTVVTEIGRASCRERVEIWVGAVAAGE